MTPIEAIEHLCDVLTREALTMESADAAVAAAGITEVEITPAPGGDEPFYATATLADPTTLDALSGSLGEPIRSALMADRPTEYIFYPPADGDRRHEAAVIVQTDDGRVWSVTVRRDPRLS